MNQRMDRFESTLNHLREDISSIVENIGASHNRSGRPPRGGRTTFRQVDKDSSANYLRVSYFQKPYDRTSLTSPQKCVRKHVKLRFGIESTKELPHQPPPNLISHEILRINRGHEAKNKFMFDWGSSLTSDWNLCVQNYFYDDFRAAVRGQMYSGDLIPTHFLEEKDAFFHVYQTHMGHLKRLWAEQQLPTDGARNQKMTTQKKNSSRNSRIMTVRITSCRDIHMLAKL